jgi:hypothetical protein
METGISLMQQMTNSLPILQRSFSLFQEVFFNRTVSSGTRQNIRQQQAIMEVLQQQQLFPESD